MFFQYLLDEDDIRSGSKPFECEKQSLEELETRVELVRVRLYFPRPPGGLHRAVVGPWSTRIKAISSTPSMFSNLGRIRTVNLHWDRQTEQWDHACSCILLPCLGS